MNKASPKPFSYGRLQGEPTTEVRDACERVICEIRSPDADELAALFSAAPDLLEACEEGLRMCEQIRRVYDGPGLYYIARMEEDFRAAIAKARG